MKILVVLSILFVSCSLFKTNNTSFVSNNKVTLYDLNGHWMSVEDSLSKIVISDGNWGWEYNNESLVENYKIEIIDKLPKYVDESIEAEFLILSNQLDTLEYEVMGFSDSLLSLRYYPIGNMHLYCRIK